MRRASSLWRAGLSRSASRTLSIGDTFARWNVVHTARPGPARRAIETANTMRNMYNQQWKVDMSSGSSSSSPRETEREWERASGTEKGKYIHTIFHSLAHILFLIHSAFGAYTIDSVIFAVCASLSVCLCVSVADDWYTFYSRVVLSSLNENRFENVQIYIFCIYIRFVCTDGLNANQVFGNRKHAHTHTQRRTDREKTQTKSRAVRLRLAATRAKPEIQIIHHGIFNAEIGLSVSCCGANRSAVCAVPHVSALLTIRPNDRPIFSSLAFFSCLHY